MNRVIIIIMTFICLCFCACPNDDGHPYIKILNKSDKMILFQEIADWTDFSFYCDYRVTPFLYRIPSDSFYLHKAPKDWKDLYWEEYLAKGKTTSIFVVDADTYFKYWEEPCDTIRKYVPILHLYQLKLEDLERMNWTVVYPPEE